MVSTDAAIAVCFGILSTIITIIGAIISYLTLKRMTTEQINPMHQDLYLRLLDQGKYHRHEHTYLVTPPSNPPVYTSNMLHHHRTIESEKT